MAPHVVAVETSKLSSNDNSDGLLTMAVKDRSSTMVVGVVVVAVTSIVMVMIVVASRLLVVMTTTMRTMVVMATVMMVIRMVRSVGLEDQW